MTREPPQQMPKPQVLANFRPEKPADPRRAAFERSKAKKAKREGNSARHLALVRDLTCCVCPVNVGVEAHHLKTGPARLERGMGRRASDQRAVPLCAAHHATLEAMGSRRETEWFADFGYAWLEADVINEEHSQIWDLAEALYRVSGNLDAMKLVLQAHKMMARKAIATAGT